MAFVADIRVLGIAIVAIVLVNAAFALLQERQAEQAVETLAKYLPEHAMVIRDGKSRQTEARTLVPGDFITLDEGDKVPADVRLVDGRLEVDLSMLTGESTPAQRVPGDRGIHALSGGSIPLPLTVLRILAIDLGTETLPALAVGRERAEPGSMSRPPRPSSQGVISKEMLIRSWGYLVTASAALVMTAFFYVLWRAGWHPGDPTGPGTPLHHAYVTETTATFAGIVTCQVGTAVAARTDHASLRAIGFFTNPLLLAGIAFELVFTAVLVYVPLLQGLFGTAALPLDVVALIAVFPVLVWGTDELRRLRRRTRKPAYT